LGEKNQKTKHPPEKKKKPKTIYLDPSEVLRDGVLAKFRTTIVEERSRNSAKRQESRRTEEGTRKKRKTGKTARRPKLWPRELPHQLERKGWIGRANEGPPYVVEQKDDRERE